MAFLLIETFLDSKGTFSGNCIFCQAYIFYFTCRKYIGDVHAIQKKNKELYQKRIFVHDDLIAVHTASAKTERI